MADPMTIHFENDPLTVSFRDDCEFSNENETWTILCGDLSVVIPSNTILTPDGKEPLNLYDAVTKHVATL